MAGEAHEKSLQYRFLTRLKEMVPRSMSFVDELTDILKLSTDSVYRRLRCETALSLDEVSLLCKHFNVSFDMFSEQEEGNVTFNYSLLHSGPDFKKYLQALLGHMEHIELAKKKELIYAAVDVPIFHYFNYKKLAAFKFFYWLKGVINDPKLEGEQFDPNLLSEDLLQLGKQIYDCYSKLPSIEIWSETTINGFLKQIEFYWDSGMFKNREDALDVCRQAVEMLERLEKQAENSSKLIANPSSGATFTMYHCELEIGNNCVYITIGDTPYVYLSFHTFNKMITTNAKYCEETHLWQQNLIKKSSLISGVSQKQRYQFFKMAFEKIELLNTKIKNT